MNGLEKLVPDLALCKQIPAGEFADSVLVHIDCHGQGWDVVERRMIPRDEPINFPAPTLAEICKAIPGVQLDFEEHEVCVFLPYRYVEWGEDKKAKTAEDAALRLWLRIRETEEDGR